MLGNASSEFLKIQNLRVCLPILLHIEQHLDERLVQWQLPYLLDSETMVMPLCVQFFHAKGTLRQTHVQIWKNKPMEAGGCQRSLRE